jgi:hypothetical protein
MMNVSIKTDQYGIQLCTDKEGVDNTLELHDVGEIRRIQSACEDFIRADKTGMSELKISFSHNYPKLHGQTFARLVAIEIHEREEMLDRFIQYDTKYLAAKENFPCVEEFYPLPSGKYLVLLFWGNDWIPFTTVRPWTFKKALYYQSNIGKTFKINIKDKP